MKYLLIPFLVGLTACSSVVPDNSMNPPVIESKKPISNYAYALILDTKEIQSAVVKSDEAYTKAIDPADAIAGKLLKSGVSRIYKAPESNLEKGLLVNWGISGSRNIGAFGAYSQEVTILIRQMNNLDLVYKCSAEGMGATDVDDIRIAINACLSGI